MKYRPPYASERLLPKNQHGYVGCRISSHWHATALATLGESTCTERGRLKGRADRRKDLMRGWKGTGDMTRAGYNQSHVPGIARAMFPDLPLPSIRQTRDFDVIHELLGKGKAINIAVRLSVLPQDQTVDPFTRADHEVTLYVPKQGVVKSIGPMRPQSALYTGHPVKMREVKRAAEAILDGLIVYEVYPIGGWTAERLATRELRSELKDAKAEVRRLERQLEAVESSKDAGWEAALIRIKEEADVLRTEGPP